MLAQLLNHLVGDGEQRFGHFIPSVLAVCRFMTNSNLVACMTGRSFALEDAADVNASQTRQIGLARSREPHARSVSAHRDQSA